MRLVSDSTENARIVLQPQPPTVVIPSSAGTLVLESEGLGLDGLVAYWSSVVLNACVPLPVDAGSLDRPWSSGVAVKVVGVLGVLLVGRLG